MALSHPTESLAVRLGYTADSTELDSAEPLLTDP